MGCIITAHFLLTFFSCLLHYNHGSNDPTHTNTQENKMEAYEIRLELLKMAKDILMEDWHYKRMAVENVYFQKREIQMAQEYNQQVVEFPEPPLVPSSKEITELASKLNEFVSKRS
jgi:hypothetical protein